MDALWDLLRLVTLWNSTDGAPMISGELWNSGVIKATFLVEEAAFKRGLGALMAMMSAVAGQLFLL